MFHNAVSAERMSMKNTENLSFVLTGNHTTGYFGEHAGSDKTFAKAT